VRTKGRLTTIPFECAPNDLIMGKLDGTPKPTGDHNAATWSQCIMARINHPSSH